MANVDITIRSIDQTKAGFASAQQSIGGLSNEVALGIGKFQVYSQIIEQVGTTLAEIVNGTVAYADEVRRLGEITGLSAEESSRLIQVSDDLKISTEDLTKAQKTLASDGLSLSIETLAKLSDQYKAIQDPAEKAAFLTDKFGKNGYKFAEAMQQGGNALLVMNGAIEQNLILTDEALQQTREYERQVDSLSDSWEGFKVSAGTKAIPILNDILSSVKKNIDAGITWRDAIAPVAMYDNIKSLMEAHRELNTEVDSATSSYTAWAESLTASKQEMVDLEAVNKEMTSTNKEILSTIGSMQSENERYTETAKRLAEERAGIAADDIAALEENSLKAEENAARHDQANKEIMLGLLERKLMQDGILTDDELNWLLEKGVAWGVYSQTVVDETQKAIAEVNALVEGIGSIPTSKEFTLMINQVGSTDANYGGSGASQVAGRRAAGGPVSAGQTYLVGEQGMELFTPSQSGTITPNDKIGGGVDTDKIVAAVYASKMDEAKLARLIVEGVLRQSR